MTTLSVHTPVGPLHTSYSISAISARMEVDVTRGHTRSRVGMPHNMTRSNLDLYSNLHVQHPLSALIALSNFPKLHQAYEE